MNIGLDSTATELLAVMRDAEADRSDREHARWLYNLLYVR